MQSTNTFSKRPPSARFFLYSALTLFLIALIFCCVGLGTEKWLVVRPGRPFVHFGSVGLFEYSWNYTDAFVAGAAFDAYGGRIGTGATTQWTYMYQNVLCTTGGDLAYANVTRRVVVAFLFVEILFALLSMFLAFWSSVLANRIDLEIAHIEKELSDPDTSLNFAASNNLPMTWEALAGEIASLVAGAGSTLCGIISWVIFLTTIYLGECQGPLIGEGIYPSGTLSEDYSLGFSFYLCAVSWALQLIATPLSEVAWSRLWERADYLRKLTPGLASPMSAILVRDRHSARIHPPDAHSIHDFENSLDANIIQVTNAVNS